MAGNHNSGGWNRKSADELRLSGGYRRDRHSSRGSVQDMPDHWYDFDPATPPDWAAAWLCDDGRAFWALVAPELHRARVLTILDLPAFSMMAQMWGYGRRLYRELQEHGWTYMTRRGVEREHPRAKCYLQASRMFLDLAEKFGLTPLSRRRIGIILPPTIQSDLDETLETGKSRLITGGLPTRVRVRDRGGSHE